MPYIPGKDRANYSNSIDKLIYDINKYSDPSTRAGHLNYVITTLLREVYTAGGIVEPKYRDHNEIIGVLECIKLEFYRRKTAPYEDGKIKTEGDLP